MTKCLYANFSLQIKTGHDYFLYRHRDEVTESKRKAAELEKACQNLIEEEEKRRSGDHGSRMQEIEDQLSNIVVPKSPSATWASSTMDDPTHTLDHMRYGYD